ncbi:MAG: hypothetical protein JNK46_18475 [Methylobacteriaceae bacterium]|nr:hypothetical protein [Methylobacteriaceae bacterium]
MPDPIWLDTNAVSEAIKGDIDVRNQLQAFRGAGRKLLITSHVESELLNGNVITETKTPPPALRAAKVAALAQLGIETDRSADGISGQKRRSYIFDTKAPSGEVSISDRMVLGTIKASAEARGVARPEVFTLETGSKAMVSQSSGWGIKAVVLQKPGGAPPSGAPPAGKPPAAAPSNGTPPAAAKPPVPGGANGATADATTTARAMKAQTRNLAPEPPKITIADHPPTREGKVTRFFDDRPVLRKVGLVGGVTALNIASGKIMEKLEAHFLGALDKASKDFAAHFPGAPALAAQASLEALKSQASKSLASFMAASGRSPNPKAFGNDRVAALRATIAWLAGRKDRAGAQQQFDAAATTYINAMADLVERLDALRRELAPRAADIRLRSDSLLRHGETLIALFDATMQYAAAAPFVREQWYDVRSLGMTLRTLGEAVGSLATEMEETTRGYERLQRALLDELQRISEALPDAAPA